MSTDTFTSIITTTLSDTAAFIVTIIHKNSLQSKEHQNCSEQKIKGLML